MLNSRSKVNVINLNYTQKLKLKIRKSNVRAQTIDIFILKIFKIVIADFQIEDKFDRPRFFQEIFLLANTKFEIILEMFFLKHSNIDILYSKKIFM